MFRLRQSALAAVMAVAAGSFSVGCTSPKEYVNNGFKVGPNYCRPEAPVADQWIKHSDKRVRDATEDLSRWWAVFNDPVLDRLITIAYQQNLTLRQAAFRVLQARAQLGIDRGKFFPQTQTATGSYQRTGDGGGFGVNAKPSFADQWSSGFNLNWELDVWGRLRRQIASSSDLLDASVEDYDAALVTLVADVAKYYVNAREAQERISLLRKNVKLQQRVRDDVARRLEVGPPAGQSLSGVDLDQATSNLKQTQSQIPQREIDLRQAINQLSILLGMPPVELEKALDVWAETDKRRAEELDKAENELENLLETGNLSNTDVVKRIDTLWKVIGTAYIPNVPRDVAVGIPADLLRRRPDVRAAERTAAAQAEQIGFAQAELYPLFTLNGGINYQAASLGRLFTSESFSGKIGPQFSWEILNYGRIVNNVRLQDAKFREDVVAYQSTVLTANQEVENALVGFLQGQDAADLIGESAEAGERAVVVGLNRLRGGTTSFNQYAVIETNLVNQEDLWAQERANVALSLVEVYRALGGGWEIRLQPEGNAAGMPAAQPNGLRPPEEVRSPTPEGAAPANDATVPKRPQARPEAPKPLPADPLAPKGPTSNLPGPA